MRKTNFAPRQGLYIALGLLHEGKEPKGYLIPSTVWLEPSSIFVGRDYEAPGLKSKPEWGINVSAKSMEVIEQYAFSKALAAP
jgi:hypothetical protein